MVPRTMEQMQVDDAKDESHIIEWRIENFTDCFIEEGNILETDGFTAGNLFQTQWVLIVHPKGTEECPKSLSCYLKRVEEKENVGPTVLHIHYEFSLVTFDGVQMFKKGSSDEFKRNYNYGFHSLVTLEEVFRYKEFLLQHNILTIRCELRFLPPFKKQTSHQIYVTKFPHVTVQESLTLEHFRNITKENPRIVKIKEANNLLSLKVSLNQDKACVVQVDENELSCAKSSLLHIVMMKEKAAKPIHVYCWIKILDKKLEYAVEKQASHLFFKIGSDEEWILPYFIDTGNLGDDCIHEDETLYIDFDFIISYRPPQTSQRADLTPLKVKEDPRETTLMKDLVDLHKTNMYSDVTLRIGNEKFLAHKSILAARSPRFDEIFTSLMEDTTNRVNPVVEIDDVDKNTMALMLKYIYTDELEDINDEDCLFLYSSAQKYQISSLLFKCYRILKQKLSVKSVYAALLEAHYFKDSSLKMMAQDWILKHYEYVFLTPEWHAFSKECEDLSKEIMRCIRQQRSSNKED